MRCYNADDIMAYAKDHPVGIDEFDIAKFPIIDAEPVVRCKDSIHGIDRQNLTMDGEWVTLYCPVIKCKRVGSMFCSEGRGKDDEQR